MSTVENSALDQVLDALETLDIPYMVVGSFASAFWGRPRTTHDADLVIELSELQVMPLVRLLAPHFYAPEFVIADAVGKRDQFNAIHLESAFKVDFWLLKDTPYAQASFQRRLLGLISGREAWVTSPEDTILSKLVWYREAPSLERQFQDVLEVYEVQEPYLEQTYLDHWADFLEVRELLDRVRGQAALPRE